MCYQVSVESEVISDIVARATRDACVRSYVGGFNLCHVCIWPLPYHTHPFESTDKTSFEKMCARPGERKKGISGCLPHSLGMPIAGKGLFFWVLGASELEWIQQGIPHLEKISFVANLRILVHLPLKILVSGFIPLRMEPSSADK